MDHLYDYILWMGELDFAAYPFNELDALVLCMLSYYDFAPVFSTAEGTEITLRDCRRMLEENTWSVRLVGKDRGFAELLRAAVDSRRFGQLRLSDYTDLYRLEPPLQFAALTFHGPDFSFLAYRGTDDSLAGWKEDFMISFTITEAQEKAREYAERLIRGRRAFYIGGHSKGGNEALYAACTLSDRAWRKVRHVYLLDGPGFCPEVMDTEVIRRIDPRTTRVVPTFSVVGKLFEPEITDTRIVRSSASWLTQHSLDTWGVDHGRLLLAPENDPRSRWLNGVLANWIGGISQEDRVVFVNELFDALQADGARTLSDIEARGPGGLEAVLGKLLGASPVTRRTISDLPRRAILGEHYEAIKKLGLAAWLRGQYWIRQTEKVVPETSAAPESGDRKSEAEVPTE